MAGYIPTRLVPVLDARALDEIEEVNLERLLGTDEAADLEFKQQHYGTTEGDKKEMAYDIADRANDVGGLIIIGIAEDSGGCAIALTPVDPDPHGSEETTRIYQVAGSKIRPYPEIAVRKINSTTEPGKVFYIISVPPSNWGPHGVLIGDHALRWPRRSGTSRRWLSESEIADAYRQRHGKEEDQIDQAHEIHREMAEELSNADGWLIVSLVPNRAGNMAITAPSIEEYRVWVNRRRSLEFPAYMRTAMFGQVRADFRSVRFSDAGKSDLPPYSQQGRMYEDGSGTLATKYPVDERGDFLEIADEVLLGDVINSLLLLGAHAVERSLTGGDAVVLAQLFGSPIASMVLTGWDGVRSDQLDGSVRVSVATPRSRHMVSLEDIATPGQALLRAARPIVADLMSPFGIPESRQLTEDGVIALRLLPSSGSRQQVQGWAEQHGVETLP